MKSLKLNWNSSLLTIDYISSGMASLALSVADETVLVQLAPLIFASVAFAISELTFQTKKSKKQKLKWSFLARLGALSLVTSFCFTVLKLHQAIHSSPGAYAGIAINNLVQNSAHFKNVKVRIHVDKYSVDHGFSSFVASDSRNIK